MPNGSNRGFDRIGPDGIAPPKGNNHLFVVGIDTYHKVGKLANARGDAEALVDLLKTNYQFDPELITEIYDEAATRRNIMHELRDKLQALEENDNLLIFYSGHGHFDPVFKEGYWVPVDADFDSIESYVSYEYLLKVARAAEKARHVMFIVDSCYSGAALVKGRDTNQSRLEKDPSRWIIASGRNEVVPDGVVGEHSPFATELLEILEDHASEGIHTMRLIDRLTENVSWNSHQTPIGQPLHGVGHKGGQFVFNPKKNEKQDWARAQQLDTVASYDSYLKVWPKGEFVAEAEWKRCCARNTKAAYRNYAESEGPYWQDALERLAAIEDRERYERAKRHGEAALMSFVHEFSDSAFVEEAEAEIERIRAREKTGSRPRSRNRSTSPVVPVPQPEPERFPPPGNPPAPRGAIGQQQQPKKWWQNRKVLLSSIGGILVLLFWIGSGDVEPETDYRAGLLEDSLYLEDGNDASSYTDDSAYVNYDAPAHDDASNFQSSVDPNPVGDYEPENTYLEVHSYQVDIDACHSELDDTETTSKINVDFYSGTEKLKSKYRSGVDSGCNGADPHFTFETEEEVTHIVIRTNGDDGYYIDEIRLYKDDKIAQHYGVDDGNGWCLSTDPADAYGGWQGYISGTAGECVPAVQFEF